MKKVFGLLSLLAVFSFTTGCQNKNEKKMDPGKIEEAVKNSPNINQGSGTFTIDAPPGWTKYDTTMMGLKTILLMSEREGAGDMFQENINVLTEKTGSMSLDEYTDLSEKNITKMLDNFKLISKKDIEIDGVPARSWDYSHTSSGFGIDVNAVFLIKDGIAYIITASVEKGDLDKWRPDIEKAIASFHIK